MRISRRRFLTASAATLAAAGGGVVHANSLETVRSARPRRPGADPLRIALITDVHAPHTHVGEDDIVARVRDFDPHLLLIGGDSINRRESEHHLALYERLPARTGKFAVFGNHERWGGFSRQALARAYEPLGVRLLVNERLTVDHSGEPVALVGLDDWRAGAPDLSAVGRLTDPRPPATAESLLRPATIVLSHCPIVFDQAERCTEGPAYMFSGHTHGGQVAPLGMVLATPHGSGRYVRGWYTGSRPSQLLYVSRGIGHVGVPFRIGARPEISLITI